MGKIVLRLDRMMVERKMSLNELAERVGISNVNLSKIKNNRVTAVRFSTLAAIRREIFWNTFRRTEDQPGRGPADFFAPFSLIPARLLGILDTGG